MHINDIMKEFILLQLKQSSSKQVMPGQTNAAGYHLETEPFLGHDVHLKHGYSYGSINVNSIENQFN